ncbi:MAG: DUF3775 domain-containing protein [Afipia felis]|nr:DUF3775 domain-containing protein [Afipia felis]
MAELTISAPQVEFLIVKAREFEVKEGATDPDEGSNGTDDRMIDVLTDHGDDPVVSEIAGFVTALSDDEQVDLVALLRLGRGDAVSGEWSDLRAEVARNYDRRSTICYLLGQPMLADFLAEGLEELGLSDSRGERMTPVS